MANVDDLITKYYGHVRFGQKALEIEIAIAIAERPGLVLDAGCGADAPLTRKFSEQATVIGVDLCIDPAKSRDVLAITADLARLPFPDNCFSVVYTRSVFEHLIEPEQVLQELHGVMEPGGVCLIETPSAWDYASIAARLSPQKFHQWYVGSISGSEAYDTFPVVYRANSPGFYKRYTTREQGKWKTASVEGLRHYPYYLSFSRVIFRLGIAYDWVISQLGLKALQPTLLVKLVKAAAEQPGESVARADSLVEG